MGGRGSVYSLTFGSQCLVCLCPWAANFTSTSYFSISLGEKGWLEGAGIRNFPSSRLVRL